MNKLVFRAQLHLWVDAWHLWIFLQPGCMCTQTLDHTIDHIHQGILANYGSCFLSKFALYIPDTLLVFYETLGSLYVRTNLLKFQEACTYTYKLTKISVSLYVRTNLLDVQTYSNIYNNDYMTNWTSFCVLHLYSYFYILYLYIC